MRGVVGISFWNVIIIGIVALAWIMVWNEFAAGKTVGGVTLGRA
jgi:hypothetical protein